MDGIRASRRTGAALVLTATLAWVALAGAGESPELDKRLESARDALAAGRPDEAERLYRRLIAADPQRVEPYAGLAEVYVARGQRQAAVTLILQVARKLIPSRRYAEAIAPLARAAELAPERVEIHTLLGRALAEERRYASAARVYERAVALGASDLETLLYLAASNWESEQLEAAEAAYRRALELHADAFGAHFHFGQFLLFEGRAAGALRHLERAAAERPERADVAFHLARARAESGDSAGAVAAYDRVLELDGEDGSELREKARRALAPLRARVEIETSARLPSSAPDDARDDVVFTAAAGATGIRFRHDPGMTERRHLPETMGAGLAWLDADGDGWLDLYLVQSGPYPPDGSAAAGNRLFRNLGDGGSAPPEAGPRHIRFADVTERAGAGDRSYGQGALAGDVDGDGDTDLYLTNVGPDVFLRNRGDGTFEDATAGAGLGAGGWSSSAALADADGDGDLDLYVARYVDYDPAHGHTCGTPGKPDYCNAILFDGIGDLLYRQRDDGSFEDVTTAAGLAAGGRGLGVVWSDLDGDRFPDLYVANDLDPNRLYRASGGTGGRLRFEDLSLLSGAAFNAAGEAEAGMGVAAGDLDGDGLPELAVTNFDVETNTLYRNLGRLTFADVSARSGFGLPSFNLLGFGIALADFDGDGDLDAYVANGHVFERPRRETTGHAQPDLLLLGDGRGGFRGRRLPADARIGRGVAVADYDNDGDPDVAVANNRGEVQLWRNDSAPRRWLGVELAGRGRNTQAIGARARLVTGGPGSDAGDRRSQVRWVIAGQGYQSSSDRRALFAWPAPERALELEVLWPSSHVTRLLRPPENRYLRLVEPADAP